MPREKFQALTEQMFYILLCLKDECCGMDIMTRVEQITAGDFTIRKGAVSHDAASNCLRNQAEMMISPYLKDRFSFRGI